MTVREFFANLNRIVANYNVAMRDVSSSTEHRNSVNTLMENEDLYNDWKNATILSWYVVDNEFVLTVQKETKIDKCCEVFRYLLNKKRKAESMPHSDAIQERIETLREVIRYIEFLLKEEDEEDE